MPLTMSLPGAEREHTPSVDQSFISATHLSNVSVGVLD